MCLESSEIQTNLGFKLEVNIEKKPLEIPVQERLLPIGTTINLVQKINKTFAIGDLDSASQSSSLNREDSSEKEQVMIYVCTMHYENLCLHNMTMDLSSLPLPPLRTAKKQLSFVFLSPNHYRRFTLLTSC